MIKKTLTLALVLLISACVDEDKNSSDKFEVIQGMAGVQGLGYKTASQQGITGEQGEFSFIEGESVQFFIGNVQLLELDASNIAGIESFAFGTQLPTTEKDLRSILDNSESELQHFINKLAFLASLDDDNDYTNGINVSGWADTLSAENISFQQSISDFYWYELPSLAAKYTDLNENVDISNLVASIFDQAGIVIPASIASGKEFDEEMDDVIDSSDAYEYDSLGNKIKYSTDFNHDGIDDYVYEYTYNDLGSLLTTLTRKDYDRDGNFDYIENEISQYNDNNRITSRERTRDMDADGTVDNRYSYQMQYNEDGEQTSYIYEYYVTGTELPLFIQKTEIAYDGNERTSTYTKDDGGDGEINSSSTSIIRVNDLGQTVFNSYSRDDDQNGLADYVSITEYEYDEEGREVKTKKTYQRSENLVINESTTVWSVFDAVGNRVQRRSEKKVEPELEDKVDYSDQTDYIFNDQGNTQQWLYIRDNEGDGTTDYIRKASYLYDENGNQIEYLYQQDDNADDVIDSSRKSENSYNDENLRISSISTNDDNADGIADSIGYSFTSYSTFGKVLTEEYHDDEDADGNIDAIEKESYSYNDAALVILTIYEEDEDADGTYDYRSSEKQSYHQIENGIAYLITYYLD